MSSFLLALAVLLLLVVSAWLKLRPSARERSTATLRAQAMRDGLRVRWLAPAEARALGVGTGLTWYECEGADPARPVGTLLRGPGGWHGSAGEWLPDLAGLPDGAHVVRYSPTGVAVAWDEGDPGALPALVQWLRRAAGGT